MWRRWLVVVALTPIGALGCSDDGGAACDIPDECVEQCEIECEATSVMAVFCRENLCSCQCAPDGGGGSGGT